MEDIVASAGGASAFLFMVHRVLSAVPDERPGDVHLRDLCFQTGDLILFSANPIINVSLGTMWTHCAVAIGRGGRGEGPLLLHITKWTQVPTLECARTCILRNLSHGTTRVYIRSRKDMAPPIEADRILRYYAETHNVAYEHAYWVPVVQRCCRALGLEFPSMAKDQSFCSPLVSGALVAAGIISQEDSDPVHDMWLPQDFVERALLDDQYLPPRRIVAVLPDPALETVD